MGSYAGFTPTQVDFLVDSAAAALLGTLDAVAPLKKKVINQKRIAPWYSPNLRALKQKTRQLERKTHSSQHEEDRQAWKDSVVAA